MNENLIVTKPDIKLERAALVGKIFLFIAIAGLIADIGLMFYFFIDMIGEFLAMLFLIILVVILAGEPSEPISNLIQSRLPSINIAMICVATVTVLIAITSIVLLSLDKNKAHPFRIVSLVFIIHLAMQILAVAIKTMPMLI